MKTKLKLRRQKDGCIVPISHRLNQDGYFRKVINGVHTMYHRYIYEIHNGAIPEGYEVDHLCRNRACCNPEHLHILSCSEHKTKTNLERFDKKRKKKARKYWTRLSCSGAELAKRFDISHSLACRWIREWRPKH